MHNLKRNYDKVLKTLQGYTKEYFPFDGNIQMYRNRPKFSDMEVISLAIIAESTQIDSENLLYSKIETDYPNWYKKLPHRTRFNARKKRLADLFTACASKLASLMPTLPQELIIDSIPLPICQMTREKSTTICQKTGDEIKAAKGFHACSKQYYFGYKLHLIITKTGVFTDFLITPANVHDHFFLKLIDQHCTHLHHSTLIGDRAYLGHAVQGSLFDNYQIDLQVPYRRNQKDFKNYPNRFKIIRKTVETVFAQYCDEFLIKRNYAKSFNGFFARITAKIAAKTFKQLWNFFHLKPINQTKHALAV